MAALKKIRRLVKGTFPTLLEAWKGNELIDAINGFLNITIRGGNRNQVLITKDGIKITYEYDPEKELLRRGWRLKQIVICENGQEVAYTILVK